MRIGCLHVPLFPLAARLRSEPELVGEALAVTVGDGATARIVAATRRARRAGVRPHQTLAQARVRMPGILARSRDPECERTAQETLVEAARSVSPRVEDAHEGLTYLDLEGLERHFNDEESLGRHLIAAADAAGLPIRVGIARGKLTARVAAGSSGPVTVVPPGEEAAFLAPRPLSCLSPDPEMARTLARWGIDSIGSLARLPADEVVSRLGQAAQRLHAAARGQDASPLIATVEERPLREGASLDWPLTDLEPFLFIARSALKRLCQRLEARGLACARLGLSLHLDPGTRVEHRLDLPRPTRDVKSLLTLLRLRLDRQPPGAPVTGFTLTAHPDRPSQAQLSLFGPEALSPGRLAATLARLFALLGTERIGSPRPLDSHRPESFQLVDFTPPPPPEASPPPFPAEGRGLLAVRLLRPPVPLEVEEDGTRPLRIRSSSQIHGRVRVAAGPWKVEETWWSEAPVEREYWDVELHDGELYRIYRNRTTSDWYADGIYD